MFVLCQFYVDFVVEKHNFSEKFGSDFCLSEKFFRMKNSSAAEKFFHIYMLPYMPPDTEKVLSEFQRCRYYFNNII